MYRLRAARQQPEAFAYSVAEEQALATLRAAFSSPINFSDTAGAYGDGESERRIGIVLRELGGLPRRTSVRSRMSYRSKRELLAQVAPRYQTALDPVRLLDQIGR